MDTAAPVAEERGGDMGADDRGVSVHRSRQTIRQSMFLRRRFDEPQGDAKGIPLGFHFYWIAT